MAERTAWATFTKDGNRRQFGPLHDLREDGQTTVCGIRTPPETQVEYCPEMHNGHCTNCARIARRAEERIRNPGQRPHMGPN